MKLKRRTIPILIIAIAIIAMIFLPTDIAYAVLPESYISSVSDKNLDWQLSQSQLDIDGLKMIIEAWKSLPEYDFESLKENPVIVTVIDTGIKLDHILFTGKYDENGNETLGEVDENGIGQYDVLLRDGDGNPICYNTVPAAQHYYKKGDMTDDINNKHGTHVAGIVATLIHALDLEQYIKILPIKAAYKGDFWSRGVEDAISLALEHNTAVINMSLASTSSGFAGFEDSDSESYTAHEKAILVAAAGNDGNESGKRPNIFGVSIDYTRYPAGNKNVIGVMNHTKDNKLYESDYGGSNYGSAYDICAPGSNIYSADGDGTDIYQPLSGTSMASPIVAFGAALLTMKFRAAGKDASVAELTEMVRGASSSMLKKGGVEYPKFDMNALVGFDWFNAEIVLDNPLLESQYLGSVQAVKLKFELTSQNAGGKVEWFVRGLKIGDGFEIEYTPENTVGLTEIVAVWTNDDGNSLVIKQIERTIMLVVSYVYFTSETVKTIKTSVYFGENGDTLENFSQCSVGETYQLKLSNYENFIPIDKGTIMWYVNGAYVASGEVFNFSPQTVGKFEIKAKIDGCFTEPIVLETIGEEQQDKTFRKELAIYTFAACVVIVAVVGAIAFAVIHKHRKSRK